MAGEFLLDTSVVVALFRGDQEIRRRLGDADQVFISAVVLGELHYGAEGSRWPDEQREKIEAFAVACQLLPCDHGTSRHYGRVKQELRRRGRPIPENDIWIAAAARQHELTLVSRDDHFGEVVDLKVERW